MLCEPTYSISDAAADWPARIDAACRVVEGEFRVRLDQAHAYADGRPPVEVADRMAYLKKKARTRTKWLALFTGKGYQPTPEGYKNRDYYSVGGRSYANRGVYSCMVQFPEVDAARHESLLVRLGDALHAYSAQYTPFEAAKRLYLVQWCSNLGSAVAKEEVKDLTEEERLLPNLLATLYSGLESPLQPHWLGWLNYWSEDVAAYLGFPDSRRDVDLLAHSYRTPAGAWLVKIGAEPWDAANPGHVRRAAELYQRFPRLGARPKVAPKLFQRVQA